jgi:hypothetical protein
VCRQVTDGYLRDQTGVSQDTLDWLRGEAIIGRSVTVASTAAPRSRRTTRWTSSLSSTLRSDQEHS